MNVMICFCLCSASGTVRACAGPFKNVLQFSICHHRFSVYFLFVLLQVQRWHQGNEHFGRAWQTGDVVGCMVDLNEHTMMFTLNGEVLLDDSGSELAFKDFETGEGQGCNSGDTHTLN